MGECMCEGTFVVSVWVGGVCVCVLVVCILPLSLTCSLSLLSTALLALSRWIWKRRLELRQAGDRDGKGKRGR